MFNPLKSSHYLVFLCGYSTFGVFLLISFKSAVVYEAENLFRLENIKELEQNSSGSCTEQDEERMLGLPDYLSGICSSGNLHGLSPELCRNVTCRNLLLATSAKDEVYKYANALMKNFTKPRIADAEFVNMTNNCTWFRENRGYDRKSKVTENADFPIAFNLILHTNVEQIERLIFALYRSHNQFCIHLDRKASAVIHQALQGIAKCLPNVFLASRREKVLWGGYSRLQADINCMKEQLARNRTWKYLMNTAGQAFPLRSIDEITDILRIYNGSNDIEGIYGHRVLRGRFENEWVETDRELKKTGKKNPKPPHEIDIVRGSAYGVFSRAFVDFIINDKRARDLLKWSEKTWSPDEHYWATLHHTYTNPHLRTPGGFSGKPDSKPWMAVYANWFEEPCHGKAAHGVCVFGVADLPHLMTRHELFANKFYSDYQPLALDCMRAWIEYKEVCPNVGRNYTYYRTLPFVGKRFGT